MIDTTFRNFNWKVYSPLFRHCRGEGTLLENHYRISERSYVPDDSGSQPARFTGHTDYLVVISFGASVSALSLVIYIQMSERSSFLNTVTVVEIGGHRSTVNNIGGKTGGEKTVTSFGRLGAGDDTARDRRTVKIKQADTGRSLGRAGGGFAVGFADIAIGRQTRLKIGRIVTRDRIRY